jgi:predicted transcriptional regulator
MTSRATPIKVDEDTDRLISHAAHFLDQTKKDVVDAAVREYIENHREEINEGVRAALTQLDGSTASAVSLLTGFDAAKIAKLGGIKGESS